VHEVGGGDEDLEDWTLVLDGKQARPIDRNYWGITFVDDRRFYATLRTDGSTWLVRGDDRKRTLTTLRTDAECPSLSPDGRRLVYKKRTGDNAAPWRLAVLDLRSGDERVLAETRSVDDQVEWLDDETVLYALPHDDDLGRSDVWQVGIAEDAEPRLLLSNATSPSVVDPEATS
jgi:Tol biopolymer transport system component